MGKDSDDAKKSEKDCQQNRAAETPHYQCLKCSAMVHSLSDCHKGMMASLITKSENTTHTFRVLD